ncbi:hypothetical protein L1987_13224 [Smallanthus sonchifolius]|uniref:Uncharacterized protein n=1 Tax=Smallanthus sonchifolius TaxID=185202 RepID=A0ACB9JIA6_9ASTR|nr:hypothetical protein L1987_13224 [Smallanthus sonchifolius]
MKTLACKIKENTIRLCVLNVNSSVFHNRFDNKKHYVQTMHICVWKRRISFGNKGGGDMENDDGLEKGERMKQFPRSAIHNKGVMQRLVGPTVLTQEEGRESMKEYNFLFFNEMINDVVK